MERQRQLEDMIEKNVDLYQRRLLQDELNRVMKRQQDYKNNLVQNKEMMAQHQTTKEYDKLDIEEKNKMRVEDVIL